MVTLSPAFPPRRASGIVRYTLAATFLICVFYYLQLNAPPPAVPIDHHSAPIPHSPEQISPTEKLPKEPPVPIPDTQGGASNPAALDEHADEIGPEEKVGAGQASPPEQVPEPASQPSPGSSPKPAPGAEAPPPPPKVHHPIDDLITTADRTFEELMSKESKSVGAAAEAYRNRRGRHPPPGFEMWYNFAVDNNALVIEDFFDQIYHDLNPFWAIEPARLRRDAAGHDMVITVRDGFANTTSSWFWTQIWLDLMHSLETMLPDMDIALNPMDEPRIIIPWADMARYVEEAEYTRTMPRPHDVISSFQTLPPRKKVEPQLKVSRKKWEDTKPYWKLARRGCPPDSLANTTPLKDRTTFGQPPTISMDNAAPHMYEGYVSNATLARDICHQPDLQGLNGVFIEPLSTSTTKVLFPLFGGSKLAVNNEILLPAPMYWKDEERFTGGSEHGGPWKDKENGVIWRGVATGGRNRATNWKGFQRHRFVTMNNQTHIEGVESSILPNLNFAFPEASYKVAAHAAGKLGQWLGTWTNVAFTDLMCQPNEDDHQCFYTSPYFYLAKGLTMAQQFMMKYLPDVDGNSFSGRYLGFLRSTSVPIKATVWREWHDHRLVAWKHFVPMDSRFGDYYGIMEYFLGYGNEVAGHDEEGERIASQGKTWAEKVLRKEDMQVYTLRLLLEYARLTDDQREMMGWVDDLLSEDIEEAEAEDPVRKVARDTEQPESPQ